MRCRCAHTFSTIKATTLSSPFARNSKKPSRASFVREQLVGIAVSLAFLLITSSLFSFRQLAFHLRIRIPHGISILLCSLAGRIQAKGGPDSLSCRDGRKINDLSLMNNLVRPITQKESRVIQVLEKYSRLGI